MDRSREGPTSASARPAPEQEYPLLRAPGSEVGDLTQSGKAYRAIRQRILQWSLAPGSTIHERLLMDELGIGRTPIREALVRLSAERLVVFERAKAIQIAPVNFDEVRDLYEVRLQDERLACRLFLLNVTDERARAVEGCLDRAEDLVDEADDDAIFNLDFHFHGLFYQGCQNSVLVDLHHHLGSHYYRLAYFMFYMQGQRNTDFRRAFIDSHRPMVKAVSERDAHALDRAVYEHISGSFERVVAVLN